MSDYKLGDRAVLMRLSMGLPGENRQDPGLTGAVKSEHGLGSQAGKWVKQLYPAQALAGIKKLDNEARAFHNAVTLPFDTGIGILPSALIMEYGDRMREFRGRREVLRDEFLNNPEEWIAWAIKEHNGTFDPDLYPGCSKVDGSATPQNVEAVLLGNDFYVDKEVWKREMGSKFEFGAVPLPVPDGGHFADTVASLLGTDVQAVDQRVRDAALEAERELLRRMLEPVVSIAQKLAEMPKSGKDGKTKADIIFRDSLVENLREIADLGPKLNISGDPEIDKFCAEIKALASVKPDTLRADKAVRADIQKKADDLAERLAGYNL